MASEAVITLQEHVIIVGFDALGQRVAQTLQNDGHELVVIDADAAAVQRASEAGVSGGGRSGGSGTDPSGGAHRSGQGGTHRDQKRRKNRLQAVDCLDGAGA